MLPIQRLITIYAQVLGQPDKGARVLEKYRTLPGHSDVTRSHLEGWIRGMKRLAGSGLAGNDRPGFSLIEKYVERYLGPIESSSSRVHLPPEEEIERVWLRGQIYHYLNTNPPKEEMPRLFYWLALCDRAIGYDFYFSLADLYLEECVLGHAEHPYAGKCMDEYEQYISHLYSGSAGTFIPEEIHEELKGMRRLLNERKNR